MLRSMKIDRFDNKSNFEREIQGLCLGKQQAKSAVASVLDADWSAPSFKMATCYDPTLRCIPSYPVNRLFVTNMERKFTTTNMLPNIENGTQMADTQNVAEIRFHLETHFTHLQL